jgi:hypothetical protein
VKVNFNIECTPEEARAFFGLPDVTQLQAEVMDKIRDRMMAGMEAMDPETIMKTWAPMGAQNWESMMRNFWGQAMTGWSNIPGAGGPKKG